MGAIFPHRLWIPGRVWGLCLGPSMAKVTPRLRFQGECIGEIVLGACLWGVGGRDVGAMRMPYDLGTNPYPPSPLPRTATPWVLPQLAWGLGVGGTGAPGGLTSPLAPGLLHSSFTRSLQCLWQHSPQSGGRQRSVARGPVHVPVLPDCGSWIPNSLTNAPLTPTAVALLGDTPELKRESRTGYLDLGGGLWLGWGDHPGFGNSQGWRLMCDLKIKEIWRFSQV